MGFQWLESEPNWEQLGLQYLYLEYLAEARRLNSNIHPVNDTDTYIRPISFAECAPDARARTARARARFGCQTIVIIARLYHMWGQCGGSALMWRCPRRSSSPAGEYGGTRGRATPDLSRRGQHE